MLLELRSEGCHTVFPPSLHTSGERVTWQELDGTPRATPPEVARATWADLEAAARALAVAVVLLRRSPRVGPGASLGDVDAWQQRGELPADLEGEDLEAVRAMLDVAAALPKPALPARPPPMLGAGLVEDVRAAGVALVASALGLEPQRDGPRWASFVCPLCRKERRHTRAKGDKRKSALIVHEGNGWWCEPCGARADALGLLAAALLGRTRPESKEEWRAVKALAVDLGLTLERGAR